MIYRKAVHNDTHNIFLLLKDFTTSFAPDEKCFQSSFEKLLTHLTLSLLHKSND